MNEAELERARGYQVAKSNDLIRKARYDLSLAEMKAFSFIVSKVKPTDPEFCKYTFSINEYCQVLGIDTNNGKNIRILKKSLTKLRDTSFEVMEEDGETSVGWLDKWWVNRKTGKITVRLDETMQRYVCSLYSNYTQYELLICLPMRSSYSVRIYELLKSYSYKGTHTFDLEELKAILKCEHYTRFPDFRRKVLDIAESEINKFSDISVQWEPVKSGRKVISIKFKIKTKSAMDRAIAAGEATRQIDGQMTIFDYIPGDPDQEGAEDE